MIHSKFPSGRKATFFIGINWREGGVVSDHFRAMAQELVKSGHQVVLIADQQRYDLEDREANPAIWTWPSPAPTRPQDLVFLTKLIRRYRPDCLIGVFSSVNTMMLGGWLAGVQHRIAWYRTTSKQSVFESQQPGALQRIYQVQRKKLVYRMATHLITSTEAMRKDIQDVYRISPTRVDIFPNAIRDPGEDLADKQREAHKVVCVGRICRLKGQETLIRAAGLLVPTFPNLRVEFYGSGPEVESMQTLAHEVGVDRNCRFHGEVPHTVVMLNMAASAVTAVPSKDEAFGYVNIESMSVGTPVVASRVGGIPEIIRDGVDGFLVPPDDPEALAERLRQLLADRELRERMGCNARRRFLEVYELNAIIERQADYFENIVQHYTKNSS